MSRKIFLPFIVILFSFFMVTPARAGESYHAERFDVLFDIQPDGSTIITETVKFRFDGGPFTYAYREISSTETDGLTFLDASIDGVPMSHGTDAGQVEVARGDPLKVIWHFALTSDTARVFVVRYRAQGVFRSSEADTLICSVVPAEHEYPIANASVTLNYPAGVRPLETPVLDRNYEHASTGQGIQLSAGEINPNESLILTAKFPSGSLARTTPLWQVRQAQERVAVAQVLPIGIFSGLVMLILGGPGLWFYIRAHKRELNLPAKSLLATPPADLSPALVGKLTGLKPHLFMGALFGLAQRGLLEVREERGAWGSKKQILEYNEMETSLEPHEQGLLNAIYESGQTQINMSILATRLANYTSRFDQLLEMELIERGWIDPQRKQVRAKLATAGQVGLLTAMGIFIGAIIVTRIFLTGTPALTSVSSALAGFSAGTVLLAIPLVVYSQNYSMLTPEGEQQKLIWQGFADYLKQVSRGNEPATRVDYFERYLPYAAVFGLGDAWSKYFKSLGGLPLPDWYHAMAGSNGDFGALMAFMSGVDTSSSAASSGGGASGGGSSGAG